MRRLWKSVKRKWWIEWDPIPVAPCSLPNPYYSYLNSLEKKSMNDWMSDEWDLIRLQSITLGEWALCGDCDTVESNELIMKSMSDNDDWLIRSSFFISNRRIWTQFLQCRQSDSGEWWLIIEYDLDIPSLTQKRIHMRWNSVQRLGKDYNVRELHSSSTIDWLIMIEMLILLIDSFDRGVSIYWR